MELFSYNNFYILPLFFILLEYLHIVEKSTENSNFLYDIGNNKIISLLALQPMVDLNLPDKVSLDSSVLDFNFPVEDL